MVKKCSTSNVELSVHGFDTILKSDALTFNPRLSSLLGLNNFQAEFKPEVFTFSGARDAKAEVGCKFIVTLTPHPNANTVKVAVYGSLDVTPLPPRTPAMVAKRNGAEEDTSGLAALSDMDRQRAKVDGIYDALIAREPAAASGAPD